MPVKIYFAKDHDMQQFLQTLGNNSGLKDEEDKED